MLNNSYQIISEVLVRGGVSTTTTASGGLYTDAVLAGWFGDAYRWATSYKKWPFTEGRASTTYAQEENTYPEGWKTDSLRFLTVDGERYQKLNFEDYRIFRDEQSDATDKVFSDFGRVYYINPNVASGTTVLYGQYTPAAIVETIVDTGIATVFSDGEEEANEAIVEEMLRYAMDREKKPNEAELHHKRAVEILERLWKNHADEQFAYQNKNRGMFERIDIVNGDYYSDTADSDQF